MALKRIKILFVLSNKNMSGAERQMYELATRLDRGRFEPTVCCLEGEGSFTEAIRNAGLPITIIHRNNSFDPIRLFKFVQYLKANRFDIVQSFCWSANNYCRVSSYFTHIPILISGERGREFEEFTPLHRIDKFLSMRSNKIVCNSKLQKEKLLKSEKLDSLKVCVIYNGIEVESFRTAKPMNLNDVFGIPKGNRVVCTVNNFAEHKNPWMFFQLAGEILPRFPRVTFLYVGSGPDEKRYRDWIAGQPMGDRIVLVGYQKNVPSILKSCHVFVLTSKWEGMPNVLLEAMAAGVPIVSSNVDGCREIISDGSTGFLIEAGDLNGFVRSVSGLLESKTLSKSISGKALKAVTGDFSVMKMVQRYENLYLGLYSGKK